MAKITIGGQEHVVPELNFMALERAWPFVEEAMAYSGVDPMKGPLAALRIIAAGIMEDENFQPQRYSITATPDNPDEVHTQVVAYLRKKLKAKEIVNLKDCIDTILQEAGLGGEPGEDLENPQKKAESPSPETAAALSQSLLQPDAKAEVGEE